MSLRLTSVAPLVLFASAASMCGPIADELPRVRSQAVLVEPAQPCAKPPTILASERPVLQKSADPGLCIDTATLRRVAVRDGTLGAEYRKKLPATLALAPSGQVAGVEFRDPCSGSVFRPPKEVRRCIEDAFAKWRFLPDADTCPATYYPRDEYVEITPRDAGASSGPRAPAGGCGG